MRMPAAALAVVAALASPSHAASQTEIHQIALPSYGSPAPARLLYAGGGFNGTIGHVLDVAPGTTRFSLSVEIAPAGIEDFDAFFYSSLDQTEPLASFVSSGAESGAIPPGARYVVVTLSAGADATFRYSGV